MHTTAAKMELYSALQDLLLTPFELKGNTLRLKGPAGDICEPLEGTTFITPHGAYDLYYHPEIARLNSLAAPMIVPQHDLFGEVGLDTAIKALGARLEIAPYGKLDIDFLLRLTLPDGRWLAGSYEGGERDSTLMLGGIRAATAYLETGDVYPVTAQTIMDIFNLLEQKPGERQAPWEKTGPISDLPWQAHKASNDEAKTLLERGQGQWRQYWNSRAN